MIIDKFRNIEINPIEVYHHKLKVLGYRIDDFTYITDAKTIPDKELKKINNSKILVINCLQIEKHVSHFNLDEVLKLIEKVNVEKVYLTHISHNLGKHDNVNKLLPKNVSLAYDNLSFSL